MASGRSGPTGRPIAQLSFAFNYYFSGFDPFAFKATNLAIHAICGLLIFILSLHLVNAGKRGETFPQQKNLTVAGILAAAWLLHPIQLTPVLHVVQRMTSLSALFLLAALLLHIAAREHHRRSQWIYFVLAWGLFWPLSFFSKETGALFPLFVLAWELIVRRHRNGCLDHYARTLAILTGLTVVTLFLYWLSPAGSWLLTGYEYRPFSLSERLLTEGRVLWFYLNLILLPSLETLGLHHDDIIISTGPLTPWSTPLALSGLALLAWLAWRNRTKAPLLSFGLAWFLIGHGLESTVLPLEIAHEHRNYLPLFGILLACTWGATGLIEKSGPLRVLGLSLASAALIYASFVTTLRAHQFGNELRRTQIEAQHHRKSPRAQYEAGRALAVQTEATNSESPAYSFARAHFERSSEVDPSFKQGLVGMMYLSCRAKKIIEQSWVEELVQRLHSTPFAPGDSNVLLALKDLAISEKLCLQRHDIEQFFSAALTNPTTAPHTQADLHSWLADYLVLRERDLPAAQIELDRALAIAPYNPGNLLKRAELAILQGNLGQAAGLLNRAQKLPLTFSENERLSKLGPCIDKRQVGTTCLSKY